MWKRTRNVLLMVVMVSILGIVTWYAISVLPYLSDVKSISKEGEIMVSTASDRLYALTVASESKEHIRASAMSAAYRALIYERKGGGNLSWHLNNLLLLMASHVHFNDKQVFGIWAYYAPYERGRGLNKAAEYYFRKPLSRLGEREYAVLISAARSPMRYKPGSEHSEQRADMILKKAENL
ncbi:MAG: hypothetical protein A2X56_10710 [Nitrospirae bacterium GWC2_57_13]|nr:MAG: hypothetical protein A2072_08560 [Nitrospirae bacterium GWC1_57_7]OGW26844.1 MAG: hypothetical protein A2X56_10710 [Nitrospirae bacterium GWC2_57_13]OGW46903.1 MAG: hypothetical protein A2X57_09610 [Nitrospirae bacterium GWD2_57_8]